MRIGRAAGAAVALGALLWSAGSARSRRVSPVEERIFRAFNDAPDALVPVAWPVMQMGSLASVFVTALGVHRRADTEGAVAVAIAGTSVWGGIKLVKPLVGRGRPDAHLADVHVRGPEQSGLGYPSGHAAVSVTLALLASRSTGARRAALAAAAATSASRMYVGAHLPLDVVGGAAAGWLAGSIVRTLRAT